jgi:hypothetical protein
VPCYLKKKKNYIFCENVIEIICGHLEIWEKSIRIPYQVGLASICHFLVLDPRLKALGPI